MRVWDVTDPAHPRLERSLRFQIGLGQEGKIYVAAIAPQTWTDGRRVLAVGGMFHSSDSLVAGRIRLVDLDTGEILGLLRGYTNAIYALAFSADGRFLASDSGDEDRRQPAAVPSDWRLKFSVATRLQALRFFSGAKGQDRPAQGKRPTRASPWVGMERLRKPQRGA